MLAPKPLGGDSCASMASQRHEGDPTAGALLRFTSVRPTGAQTPTIWKCWAPSAHDGLRWELRRIFPSLGYDVELKRGRVCDRVREMKWRWLGILQHLGVPDRCHVGDSRAALAQRSQVTESDASSAEQEFWVSTLGLIVVLLEASCSARAALKREFATCALVSFLQSTASFEELASLGVLEAALDARDKCSQDTDGEFCSCMRSWRKEVKAQGDKQLPQRRLVDAMHCMMEHLACPAISAHLLATLRKLTDCVDERVSEWGDFEYHKTSAATLTISSSGGKRRLDYHSKVYAVQGAMACKEASTSAGAARAMTVDSSTASSWVRGHMADFQAESWLCFASPSTIALSFDCARLGQPAREILLAIARNLETKKTVVLPPQAPSGCRPSLGIVAGPFRGESPIEVSGRPRGLVSVAAAAKGGGGHSCQRPEYI